MLETLYDFILNIFSYLSKVKFAILNDNKTTEENDKSDIFLQYDEIYNIENPFIM